MQSALDYMLRTLSLALSRAMHFVLVSRVANASRSIPIHVSYASFTLG